LSDSNSGCNNIALGCDSLLSNTIGSNNISIGVGAGYSTTGSSSVFIGPNAGYTEVMGCMLHIANCDQCTLILGDFIREVVTIPKLCLTCLSQATGGEMLVWDSGDKVVSYMSTSNISTVNQFTITGNSSSTSFTIIHNLLTQFPMVQVVENSTPWSTVYVDVTRPNTDCVIVNFDTAPTTGKEYKVLIVK
jgi:hypothetical protein